ncbi:class I SAM-dependent methyltransferase [Desulfoprunum benzoelyticum]|uniref:SAM-dependent methyltransferase n=1 Tax=Desulfoprunum benzoelyticum TaxID=1506996 RepID=A0A840V4K1_9BACT|nr:class I SAM-dependent methyltransferase [Desulfoprunum benzoelyticum]MBB5348810.1 SAM-dependent methyltransferase [Desulfoprunum benzoelyticum]MBM9529973.1 class I SAM-dependent methyltransferase [Desulfoprunum benzoelyticum]
MRIYEDYSDEPEVIFRPLSDALHSRLYAVEMADFADDFGFYRAHLPAVGDVLEVACGACRIGRALASCDRRVTGIDISLPMLRQAREAEGPNCRLAAMDMRQLAFRTRFDAVIIAYNSLNLLVAPDDIHACLAGCRAALKDHGRLLLQLFVPGQQLLRQPGRKIFQFQIFDDPQFGRIVKEILRTYDPELHVLSLEERYRLRPASGDGAANEDFARQMRLRAWPADEWLAVLAGSGFSVSRSFGDYDLSPFFSGTGSILLVTADRI